MEVADPWLGKTIDARYIVRRLIGRGGMGAVYEAMHVGLDRRVAIKFIKLTEGTRASDPDPTLLARFRREARNASRITHEHVVQVHDTGTEAGIDFIAMEYVEGRDLGTVLRDGPLGIARAAAIARQMLLGLHAIHEGGIIHRDIKPSNVMLTTRGTDADFVKLMDFGIARSLQDEQLTAAGLVVGTPSFMAPEQLRGEAIDHRVDVYAVGVTLFAMLAGQLPFGGDTAALAGRHVFEPPPSLARIRPGIPAALVALVERALAKSPADRFPDALAFATALDSRGAPPGIVERPARAPSTADRVTAAARPVAGRAAVPDGVAPAAPSATTAPASWWPRVVAASFILAVTLAIVWVVRSPTPSSLVPDTRVTAIPRDAPTSLDAPAVAIVTPPPGAALVDAAATGVDAAIASQPHHGTAVAIVPHRPAMACRCIPSSAPDVLALCPSTHPPLCRCDDPNGERSLCLTQLDVEKFCPIDPGSGFQPDGDRKPADCHMRPRSCPDAGWDSFRHPAKADEPCTGYPAPWILSDPNPQRPRTGRFECDVCIGVDLRAFRGVAGDPCSGFYWRTGQPMTGTLAYCE